MKIQVEIVTPCIVGKFQ